MNPKISLDKIHHADLREVLTELETVLKELDLDFYLIGALARDIMMGSHDIEPKRATRDVDLAVLVPSKESYGKLKKRLEESGNFKPVSENNYALTYKNKTEIDLLPFGGLDFGTQVVLSAAGRTSITVNGFVEVYESATEPVQAEDNEFRVCTLPGIVILKLIAYDDRPEIRVKNIHDIVFIIENYFNIAVIELYKHHNDLLEYLATEPYSGNTISTFRIGARLLGRHMNPVLSRSVPLATRITKILENAIESLYASNLAELMICDMIGSLAEAETILKELLAGINDAPLDREGV